MLSSGCGGLHGSLPTSERARELLALVEEAGVDAGGGALVELEEVGERAPRLLRVRARVSEGEGEGEGQGEGEGEGDHVGEHGAAGAVGAPVGAVGDDTVVARLRRAGSGSGSGAG